MQYVISGEKASSVKFALKLEAVNKRTTALSFDYKPITYFVASSP